MKWITLKITNLPLLMKEIDFVCENYMILLNDSRKKRNEEKMNNFINFKLEISKRVSEIEEFYEDNIHDERIYNFEKARLKLKKLLMYDPFNVNKIEELYNENISQIQGQRVNTFQNINQINEKDFNDHFMNFHEVYEKIEKYNNYEDFSHEINNNPQNLDSQIEILNKNNTNLYREFTDDFAQDNQINRDDFNDFDIEDENNQKNQLENSYREDVYNMITTKLQTSVAQGNNLNNNFFNNDLSGQRVNTLNSTKLNMDNSIMITNNNNNDQLNTKISRNNGNVLNLESNTLNINNNLKGINNNLNMKVNKVKFTEEKEINLMNGSKNKNKLNYKETKNESYEKALNTKTLNESQSNTIKEDSYEKSGRETKIPRIKNMRSNSISETSQIQNEKYKKQNTTEITEYYENLSLIKNKVSAANKKIFNKKKVDYSLDYLDKNHHIEKTQMKKTLFNMSKERINYFDEKSKDLISDVFSWKEIVFRIKLTESEYKLLMKEKEKITE